MDRQLDKLFTQFLNVAPFFAQTLLSSWCVLTILNWLPKTLSITNFLFKIEIME